MGFPSPGPPIWNGISQAPMPMPAPPSFNASSGKRKWGDRNSGSHENELRRSALGLTRHEGSPYLGLDLHARKSDDTSRSDDAFNAREPVAPSVSTIPGAASAVGMNALRTASARSDKHTNSMKLSRDGSQLTDDNKSDSHSLSAKGRSRNGLPLFDEIRSNKPLKHKVFRQYLQHKLEEVETHHQRCAASWIARATAASNAEKVFTYRNDVKVDKVSPFANMGRASSHRLTKGKTGYREQVLASFLPSDSHHKVEDSTLVYQPLFHTNSAQSIPPYTHYISSNHNILVESVKQRTFLPYLGEDDESFDAEYKALLIKIDANQTAERELLDMEEFGYIWIPYVQHMLADLGTSVNAVLRYLIDPSVGVPSPKTFPKELEVMLSQKESWISEGFYAEEDDHEATAGDGAEKPKMPQRRWQIALSNLPKIDERETAAAIVACSTFMQVVHFSLWHVVRLTEEAQEAFKPSKSQPEHKSQKKESIPLNSYINQACLVCKAHQCFGHGEYSDDDDDRKAMTSGLTVMKISDAKLSNNDQAFGKDFDDLKGLLGKAKSGAITGDPWAIFGRDSAGIDDSDVCSDDCFWELRNRKSEKMHARWSKDEIDLLNSIAPAYALQKRGACAISQMQVVEKTCVQIFTRLLHLISTNSALRDVQPQTSDLTYGNKPWTWWLHQSDTWKHQRRDPFRPCSHSGPCKNNPDCTCHQQRISCEKSCNCPSSCSRRFRGCRCAARGKPCHQSDTCDCFKLNRECDPDICHTCGVNEALDPSKRYDETVRKGTCCNVSIQRAMPKRTQLGQSKLLAAGGLSGWGLFMGEETKKGDYIGEYVGEIITGKEAEQRGIIYNEMNLSYLFDLNDKQVLDSTPIGNKLRYINHQGDEFANCRAKVMFCAGVQRIGMFATKNIEIGDELLFNYGNSFASKIDMVTMHKDGSVTVEKAQRRPSDATSGGSESDDDDRDRPHRKPKSKTKATAGHKRRDFAAGYDTDYGDDMDGDEEYPDAEDIEMEDEDDEDEDEDDDPGSRRYKKTTKKTTGGTRSHMLPSGISGSDRMRKAWVTRYANLGMAAEAKAQQKKYEQLKKPGKR